MGDNRCAKQSVSIVKIETECFGLTELKIVIMILRMDGRTLLLVELTARKSRNSAYSLRAFARDLSVSPTALSQYLSRKRELSKKNALSIMDHLRLSPLEKRAFAPVSKYHHSPGIERDVIDEDTFRLISDWQSLAVLNLALLIENRADATWISERLGVTKESAANALERVVRLKLVEVKRGKMSRTRRPFATTHDVPSAAIKRFQSSLIDKASASLFESAIDERDITSIVMPADPKKLLAAKKIIRSMRHKIAALVATEDASEVYALSVQLFPLTKKKANRRGEK